MEHGMRGEIVARRGNKPGLRALLLGSAATAFLAAPSQAAGIADNALPTGGVVTSGAAAITQSGSRMDITQTSSKAVLNWQSFNIGAAAEVNFHQPGASSVALNRVLSSDASQILGKLNANGQVILINPAGIVFGGGARVDAGGITASVLDIKDSDFLAGKYEFKRGTATGSISNQGSITAAEGGFVALLAPQIINQGIISARLGTVALAAGDAVTLSLDADGKVGLKVDPATIKAQIDQGGMLIATDGRVLMTAKAANALLGGGINAGGAVMANSLTDRGGEIVLDASGPISVAEARLDAGGATGGGRIGIGGWETESVSVDRASTLDASASVRGDGGAIAVIGRTTRVEGTLLATGGAEGGDGGAIETSGHMLSIGGATVRIGAPKGKGGTWLLDPYDLTVDDAAAASINTALASGNVSLATTNTGTSGTGTANASGSGDIIIASALSWSADTSLSLSAYHSVLVNANITANGNNAGLSVVTNNGGSGGNLLTGTGASVTLSGSAPSLSINGQAYTLINSAAAIQSLGTSGYYALAGDVSLAALGNVTPIGYNSGSTNNTSPNQFTGTLEGLGHTISGLTISYSNSAYNLGLFSKIGSGGAVRNLALSGTANMGTGRYYGLLAGASSGTILNVAASGTVTAGNNAQYIAGLIGDATAGTVTSSSFGGTVTTGTGTFAVGGLLGQMLDATLTSSHSTANVIVGANSTTIGGLIGLDYNSVTSSYATGNISVSSGGGNVQKVGGLIGFVYNYFHALQVTNSYATGNITIGTNSQYIGGLFGRAYASSSVNYATGNVTAGNTSKYVGGLFGQGDNTTSQSFATGNVSSGTGSTAVGGLIGYAAAASASSTYVYATGSVTTGSGSTSVGGLIGDNRQGLAYAYSTGAVNAGGASTAVGGLVGSTSGDAAWSKVQYSYTTSSVTGGTGTVGAIIGDNNRTATNNYWNTETSGQSVAYGGAGYGTPTSTGLTSAEMTSSASYSAFNFSTTWGMPANGTPILYGSPYVLKATIANASMTYGDSLPGFLVSYSNFFGSDTAGIVSGTVLATAATSTSGAGTYSITGSGTSATSASGRAYAVAYVPGTLTVAKAALTATATDQSVTYGGTVTQAISYAGFVGSDGAASLTTAPTVTSGTSTLAGVGTYANTLTPSGGVSGNYSFTYAPGTLTVTQAPLTVTANNQSMTYGGAMPSLSFGYAGFVGSDSAASLTTAPTVSSATAATANAGTYANTLTASGGVAGNYSFTYVPGTLTIDQRALTWSVANAASTYGTLAGLGMATLNGVVGGDTVNTTVNAYDGASATTLAATTPVGTYLQRVTAVDNANYSLAGAGNTEGTLTIDQRALTWSVANAASTYGTLAGLGTATLNGVVGGDTVNATVTAFSGATALALAATIPAGTYLQRVTALDNANYTLAGAGNTEGILTIETQKRTSDGATTSNALLAKVQLSGLTALSSAVGPSAMTTARAPSTADSQSTTQTVRGQTEPAGQGGLMAERVAIAYGGVAGPAISGTGGTSAILGPVAGDGGSGAQLMFIPQAGSHQRNQGQ